MSLSIQTLMCLNLIIMLPHRAQLSIRPHDMTLANGDGKERGNAVDAYGQLVGVEAYRMSRGQGSIEAKGNNETARRRTSTSPPKAP